MDSRQPTRGPALGRTVEPASPPAPAPDWKEEPYGPVVGHGPVTASAPLNIAMGASVVGASQLGFVAMTGGGQVLATSLFLNLVSQLVKGWKWFPEHKGLIVVMLLVSFGVGWFVFYQGDVGNSFMNMANSTMQAILNYKGDKASGLNVLAPVAPENEYGS